MYEKCISMEISFIARLEQSSQCAACKVQSHTSDFPPSLSFLLFLLLLLLLTAPLSSLNATKSYQFPQLTSTPSSQLQLSPGHWVAISCEI